MGKEKVVLVDENDQPIGLMEKIEAHQKALLHRAFSVFVFNECNEVMMQKRALEKYHSPGLWTNTCCSHPRENELTIAAGKRRLQEEMGFQTALTERTSFIYKAPFDNGLTEHEFDHILTGYFDGEPQINPEEVAEWKWMSLEEIQTDLSENPDHYTAWFKIIFEKYDEFLK